MRWQQLTKIGSLIKPKRHESPILGVHFTNTAINVAVLTHHQGRWHLLSAAQSPHDGAISLGQIVDKAKLAGVLAAIFERLATTDVLIVGGIADESVMSQIIWLPENLSDEEIEAQILLDAERYIGQNLAEVCFDFWQLPTPTPTAIHADRADVAIRLTVAYQSAVDDCVEILAMAGAKADAVDVHGDSMARLLSIDKAHNGTAIIHIDLPQIRLMIYHNHEIIYQQLGDVPVADIDTTQADSPAFANFATAQTHLDNLRADNAFAKHDSLDNNDPTAEYQIRFDDTMAPPSSAAIETTSATLGGVHTDCENRWQILSDKIAELIDGYRSYHHEPIAAVWIVGINQADDAGFNTLLNQRLNVPCQFFQPAWLQVANGFDVAKLPVFAGAIALALRTEPATNLLPWRDDRRVQKQAAFRQRCITLLTIALLAVIVIYALIGRQISHQSAINAEIAQRIDNLQARIEQMATWQQQLQQTRQQRQAMAGTSMDSQLLYRWQKLPSLLPQGVSLDSLVQTGDELTWTGMASSTPAVAAFARAVEMSGFYSDVLVVAMQKAQDGRTNFTMSATVLQFDSAQFAEMVAVDTLDAMPAADDTTPQEGGDE
ncbi:Tfp pilus assembly protein, ATPase PilM [Moraxella cuniculi DSM 21768]|uniref:Tfp pilus assembly protein, ATPase PilM n=1 Tax=Moraxella cuniculi DSM 21768 TaxID=1122245 RepID=A0A1N7E7L5_9GAMM|nr:pilus assembly protein PilM [Moraxella cuniculi]SIR83998.1 Tfp pilus assembly protein, ATPase PilM [Moraxella cuniculi DSM 21768]